MEERRISPSSHAWQKISNSLEVRKPLKKRGYWQFAAAALIAGILVSSVWLFTDNKEVLSNPQPVVNNPAGETEEQTEIEFTTPDPAIVTATTEETSNDDEPGMKTTIKEVQKEPANLVETNDRELSQDLTEVAINIDQDPLIDDKVNEVLDQVILMEETKNLVTDAEVDSLLRNAQQELMADSQFRDQHHVNASNLLAGVEEEIDKSFRDQVFEKLKEGFVKVRTAVADRNK